MNNFGRVIEVMTNGMSFHSDDFTIEGTIPFDNDPLPNESEVKLYNLAPNSIHRLKVGETLIINAGYRGDVGVILHGFISKVATSKDGVDRITTLYVMDSEDLSKREVTEKAYAAGTLASYILKDMAAYIGLPVAQFDLVQDYRYQEGFTAKGEVTKILSNVAADCKTEAFINKGKLYVRNLKRGADQLFGLSVATGLIGTPQYFEEESAKGYTVQSQLQYRITTASIIDLQSKTFQGRLYVRSGSHRFSLTGDFMTGVEAVL
ncbi:phage protein [Paenibacillus sp. strain BS8-2]